MFVSPEEIFSVTLSEITTKNQKLSSRKFEIFFLNTTTKTSAMFLKDTTIFSASQIINYNENFGINIILHFKDQKVWTRKNLKQIRYNS